MSTFKKQSKATIEDYARASNQYVTGHINRFKSILNDTEIEESITKDARGFIKTVQFEKKHNGAKRIVQITTHHNGRFSFTCFVDSQEQETLKEDDVNYNHFLGGEKKGVTVHSLRNFLKYA